LNSKETLPLEGGGFWGGSLTENPPPCFNSPSPLEGSFAKASSPSRAAFRGHLWMRRLFLGLASS